MAESYTAQKATVDSIETIHLADSAHGIEVSICPSVGNIAFDVRVHGQSILMSPPKLKRVEAESRASRHSISCALGQSSGWRCLLGERETLSAEPGAIDIRRDQNGLPIHGLLLFASAWQVARLHADAQAAEVTSRLEFWKHPEWMAQFPFAHSIEMTHRLSGGILEVRTTIENHSADPMPLVIGFHPWYQIPETPRDQWEVRLPVREHYVLSEKLIPTGETRPMDLPDPAPLAGRQLDDVFGGVDSNSEFSLEADGRKVSVRFGPKFPIAIVYAPQTRNVVCFEPMTGLTDGFNLAHDGVFKNLQSIPPGGTWTESFWIRPTGF